MKKISQITAIIFALFLGGCSNNEGLEVSGSTSIAPLMTKLIADYQEDNDIHINLNADGSSAGINGVIKNISDVGMSSRELDEAEQQENLNTYVVALDAIGAIVNHGNGITNLTVQQLHDIFSGKITNWAQVGGKDLPILIVSREDGSGTRSAFEETVDLYNEDKTSKVDDSHLIIVNSSGAVLENIIQKEGAIGYISLSTADETVKLLNINDIAATEENVKNGKYLLSRNFNIVTKNENEATKAFIAYLMSEKGQAVVKREGYISVEGGASNEK